MRPLPLIQITVILLTLTGTLQSQTADLAGYRIFVNPGHGGFDSNDRHIVATDFWESQGNLVKGLYLRHILTNINATVFMSRVTNTTADDLPLSSISAMANAANADFFLSIHSNGFDGIRNQPLMLFRGYDNQPVFPQAKSMATIMWQKVFEKGNSWTHTNLYVKGDWTFYPEWGDKVGLGVLRELTMPGVLSEGSHHDYIPESWRLRNNDFLLHESWALARSFTGFFNVIPFSHGIIAGVVRDSLKSPQYYFKPGTKDQDIPLNGPLVTLMPCNKTYQVDNLNNGFFMFDSLAPGTYTLYVDATGDYMNDTVNIIVSANQSSLADIYLQYDTTLIPELVNVTPLFTDSLLLNDEITFTFNMAMNRDSVEKHLIFQPEAGLAYTWNDASTVLNVKPLTRFSPKTNYTITLLQQACSKWKIGLNREYGYSFTTINRTKLKLEKSFPSAGQSEVTLFPQIRFVFDAPLNPALILSNIIIADDQGSALSGIRAENLVIGGKGHYRFELSTPLETGKTYSLTIKPALADLGGTTTGTEQVILFTTRDQPYPTGSTIESYDDISRFWDPEASGSTVGTDNPLTTFTGSSIIKKNGTASGQLDYVFVNASGGVCRVFNNLKPIITYNPSKFMGVWVYGDLSFNALEYWFYSYGNLNQIVPVDTIDWAGWDFRPIPLTDIGGTGDRSFHSVVIRQTESGSKTGKIWFDDALLFTTVGVDDITAGQPLRFTVYPNPYSSYTNLQFYLPQKSLVRLDIITLSGQLVKNLANAEFEAGRHDLQYFPLSSLPAGIYLFRLEIRTPDNKPVRVINRKAVFIK